MRTFAVVFLLIGVVGMAWAAERGPIVILSDEDFTPENGVVSGSGTPEDPYLIVGWDIRVRTGELFGIRIENVSAAFVVRGCTISGALHPHGAAIYLAGLTGGTVEACVVRDSLHGLVVQTSQDLVVRNVFLGVRGVGFRVLGVAPAHFRHMVDPTVTVNGQEVRYYYGLKNVELEEIQAGHITIAASENVILRGARIDQGDGITVAFSSGIRVEGADLSRARSHGILILSSPGTVVTRCDRIANSAQAGVAVILSDEAVVEHSGIYANQIGVYVNASDRVRLRQSVWAANPLAIRVEGVSEDVWIQDSFFYQNRNDIEVESGVRPVVERCAFAESDIAVFMGKGVTHPRVLYSTMVRVGYGISTFASHGVYERNLIARANIGIIFEEAYKEAFPTGNVVHANVLYRCMDGLYLGTETYDNVLYENLIWDCSRAARDLGKNQWTLYGRGNWYSNYTGRDENGDGIGDTPVVFPGGGQDPAPLMDRAFYPGIPGVVGTMEERIMAVEDSSGSRLVLPVRIADQPHKRFIGFQALPPAMAQDLAILFVFERPTVSNFHMRNVFLDLDIVFWGPEGEYLGRNLMKADSTDLYGTASPFLQALEIPAGKLQAAGLEPPFKLVEQP